MHFHMMHLVFMFTIYPDCSLPTLLLSSEPLIIESQLSDQPGQISQHRLCRNGKYHKQHHALRSHPCNRKQVIEENTAEQKSYGYIRQGSHRAVHSSVH